VHAAQTLLKYIMDDLHFEVIILTQSSIALKTKYCIVKKGYFAIYILLYIRNDNRIAFWSL